MARTLSLDSPRIRFNWGYHDGASMFGRRAWGDVETFARRHFDRVYADGIMRGFEDKRHGRYTENSDRAWTERNAERKAA